MRYGRLITERLCYGRGWKVNKLTMPDNRFRPRNFVELMPHRQET